MKPLLLSSIRTKTSLLFFAVFVIIILPINYIIYNKIKKVLTDADTNELAYEAEKLLNQVRLDPKQIPLPKTGYSEKIQLNKEIYFEEIFSSPSFPQLDQSFYFLESFHQDTLAFVNIRRNIEYSSGVILLTLMRSNQQLQSSLNDLKSYLFLANAASILLAAVFVYVVTGFSLAPVMKIVEASQRVNASNSIERVPVPKTTDEYQQLAQAINGMLARIETSIKNQTNFFASAAHELKTPLTVMKAELTLALTQQKSASVSQLLQSNLREVERLDHVIHNFLLISQLKTETLVLRKTVVQLDEILFGGLRKVKYLAQDKGTSIHVNLTESSMMALADYDMIETVIVNLLENAIKYSSYNSIIHAQLFLKGGSVRLVVRNPCSITLPVIDKLTQEFYKGEPHSSGLGLGLWICKKILAMHDAELLLSQDEQNFYAEILLKPFRDDNSPQQREGL